MEEDLAAFVTARLDELETADWHVLDCSGMPWEAGHCCDAQRWLAADVASKRAILAAHRIDAVGHIELGRPVWDEDECQSCGNLLGAPACQTIRALGAPFSALDGYRADWAPEKAAAG